MKKTTEISYLKPSKLMPFIEHINVLEKNIDNYDNKLYHLQNKMNYTLSVNKNLEKSEQFQSLVEKRERLEEKKAVEKEFVQQTLSSMLSTFKNTQIESSEDAKQVLTCIEYALMRARSEVDKGAILSNAFSVHVSPDVESVYLSGIEALVEQDRELLTGYLMYDEEQQGSSFKYNIPSEGLDKLFKNSIDNRSISMQSNEVSKIILEDQGYLEKFFDRLGEKAKDVVSYSELNKKEKAYLKKQLHKYKVERNTKPKISSRMLKLSAALPSAIGKVVFGTFYAVGELFKLAKKGLSGAGYVLASPFVLMSKGLKKMSLAADKNKTYDQDYNNILKNLRKELKKNGIKAKQIFNLCASVEQINGSSVLNLHGVVVRKDRVPFTFNALYEIKEGEYKNILETLKEKVVDENDISYDPDKIELELGQKKEVPEVIRLMRKLSEVTNDGILCLNIHKVPQEMVKIEGLKDEDIKYLSEDEIESEGDKKEGQTRGHLPVENALPEGHEKE